jgi:hypothetical protein
MLQVKGIVYVCQGRDHPALLTRTALLRTPHWLSAAHAQRLSEEGSLRCQYKARYGQESRWCTLYPAVATAAEAEAAPAANIGRNCTDSSTTTSSTSSHAALDGDLTSLPPPPSSLPPIRFEPSKFTRLQPQDAAILPGYLIACFDEPAAAITPQQAFVSYDGDVCLGSALIAVPGQTLHEEAEAV